MNKRTAKGKRQKRAGKFRVHFGVVSQHRNQPDFDGLRIKPGPGGIDLVRKKALAARLALDGYTDDVIARIAGVSPETLDYWRAMHGDLDDAIRTGRTAADAQVVATLHMLATGYEREEETVAGKDATKVRFTKYHAPDISAIKYWLENRSDRWASRQKVELTGRGGKPLMPKESKADIIASIVGMIKPKKDK